MKTAPNNLPVLCLEPHGARRELPAFLVRCECELSGFEDSICHWQGAWQGNDPLVEVVSDPLLPRQN